MLLCSSFSQGCTCTNMPFVWEGQSNPSLANNHTALYLSISVHCYSYQCWYSLSGQLNVRVCGWKRVTKHTDELAPPLVQHLTQQVHNETKVLVSCLAEQILAAPTLGCVSCYCVPPVACSARINTTPDWWKDSNSIRTTSTNRDREQSQ